MGIILTSTNERAGENNMNNYILDEFFLNKTIKQIEKMVINRIKKIDEADEILEKYEDDYRYENCRTSQTKVKKANTTRTDCRQWLESATYCLSEDLFNSMVLKEKDYIYECFDWASFRNC